MSEYEYIINKYIGTYSDFTVKSIIEDSHHLDKDILSNIKNLGEGEVESFTSKLNKDHKVLVKELNFSLI